MDLCIKCIDCGTDEKEIGISEVKDTAFRGNADRVCNTLHFTPQNHTPRDKPVSRSVYVLVHSSQGIFPDKKYQKAPDLIYDE